MAEVKKATSTSGGSSKKANPKTSASQNKSETPSKEANKRQKQNVSNGSARENPPQTAERNSSLQQSYNQDSFTRVSSSETESKDKKESGTNARSIQPKPDSPFQGASPSKSKEKEGSFLDAFNKPFPEVHAQTMGGRFEFPNVPKPDIPGVPEDMKLPSLTVEDWGNGLNFVKDSFVNGFSDLLGNGGQEANHPSPSSTMPDSGKANTALQREGYSTPPAPMPVLSGMTDGSAASISDDFMANSKGEVVPIWNATAADGSEASKSYRTLTVKNKEYAEDEGVPEVGNSQGKPFTVRDGLFYDENNHLMDTSRGFEESSSHANVVMKSDGSLYYGKAKHHHLAGEEVAAALTLSFPKPGQLAVVTDQSGHFEPPPEFAAQFLEEIAKHGVDLSKITVYRFSGDGLSGNEFLKEFGLQG